MERLPVSPALHHALLDAAQEFRKAPTASEDRLWQALRRKQLDGRKFRRQQPIGRFITDFFCAEERLIVEVDGSVHALQRAADAERQRMLEAAGYRVIRVSAEDVETNLVIALARIQAAWTEPQ